MAVGKILTSIDMSTQKNNRPKDAHKSKRARSPSPTPYVFCISSLPPVLSALLKALHGSTVPSTVGLLDALTKFFSTLISEKGTFVSTLIEY